MSNASTPTAHDSHEERLRLDIDPVIASADGIERFVRESLPGHAGLARAARGVASAAHEARRVSFTLKRVLSWHRVPVLFLAAILIVTGVWLYGQFFRTTTLRITVSDRDDAAGIRERLSHESITFEVQLTEGSRENVARVEDGRADLAWVQGGVPFPKDLPHARLQGSELILLLAREKIAHPADIRRVLTSSANQGSHSVAMDVFKAWQIDGQVSYTHDWSSLAKDPSWKVPSDIDAVWVVKDPASEPVLKAIAGLYAQGFRLLPVELGARASRYPYLQPTSVPTGFLQGSGPAIPASPIASYSVSVYLIARKNLTPRLLDAATSLLSDDGPVIASQAFKPTWAEASAILQGVEAILGIVVYIGVVFLALTGIDMLTYRRRFNELDSLASLISMHQSTKDVLGVSDPVVRAERLRYLGKCSDLLGLISVIAGYYTQENAALLLNGQLMIIHERCNALKLNIQLKILHAGLDIRHGEAKPAETPIAPPPPEPPKAA